MLFRAQSEWIGRHQRSRWVSCRPVSEAATPVSKAEQPAIMARES